MHPVAHPKFLRDHQGVSDLVSKISKPRRVAVHAVRSVFSFKLIFGLWEFSFTFLRAQHFFPSWFLVFSSQIFFSGGEGYLVFHVGRSEYLFCVLTCLWPTKLVEMGLFSHPVDLRSSILEEAQGRGPARAIGCSFFSLWASVVVASLKLSRLFLPWLGVCSLGAETWQGTSLGPQPQGPVTIQASLSLLPGIMLRSSILKS